MYQTTRTTVSGPSFLMYIISETFSNNTHLSAYLIYLVLALNFLFCMHGLLLLILRLFLTILKIFIP